MYHRRAFWKGLVTLMLALLLIAGQGAAYTLAANNAETVRIQVTYGQTEARALVERMNQVRQNLSVAGLTYDYGLENLAMEQAAELALVDQSWFRPDSTSRSTYFQSYIQGNFTMQTFDGDAAALRAAWMDDATSAGYGSLTSSNYQAVGIGHVTYQGQEYWAAVYGDTLTGSGTTAVLDAAQSVTISLDSTKVQERRIAGAPTGTLTLYVGESYSLTGCRAELLVNGHTPQGTYCQVEGDVSVTSTDQSVVSYNGTSLVANAVGTARIVISCGGSTQECTVVVNQSALTGALVSAIPDQTYTGYAITPGVSVQVGGTALVANKDYTLSYSNNVNVGTATVTITGTGSYRGTKTVSFRIISGDSDNTENAPGVTGSGIVTRRSLTTATVKVSNQTYNGKAKKPAVKVSLNGETLKEGTDYTCTYSNNKKPGQANIKITGKGNYRGTKTATFVILPKKLTLKSVAARTNAAYLTWKSDKTVSGYELYRSKKKSSGYKRIGTISQVDASACTNTNMSAGTYYYKMRSFVLVNGTRYYGAFTSVKKVKVK